MMFCYYFKKPKNYFRINKNLKRKAQIHKAVIFIYIFAKFLGAHGELVDCNRKVAYKH